MKGRPSPLILQARGHYVQCLVAGLRPLVDSLEAYVTGLIDKPAERSLTQVRREAFDEFRRGGLRWIGLLTQLLHELSGEPLSALSGRPMPQELTLVDDDAVERRIALSRLSHSMRDKAGWQFADLQSRLSHLGLEDNADSRDVFQTSTLAETVYQAWEDARLSLSAWQTFERSLHAEFADLVLAAVHDTNRWFIAKQVLPQVDLRPFIRRAADTGIAPGPRVGTNLGASVGAGGSTVGASGGMSSASGASGSPGSAGGMPVHPGDPIGSPGHIGQRRQPDPMGPTGSAGPAGAQPTRADLDIQAALALRQVRQVHQAAHAWANSQTLDETRLQTRVQGARVTGMGLTGSAMIDWMERRVPGLARGDRGLSGPLEAAMRAASVRPTMPATDPGDVGTGTPTGTSRMTPSIALDHLRARTRSLKEAASTPVERATVELVALMFQSLLTEERLPAGLRVWFARLQMPVLRMALSEPEFFAATDHPARKLIDRMGSCVMGFEGAVGMVGDVLEVELRRIVQVIEAFPDSGRRVFQTVLNEFEQFLERYFASQQASSHHGVSLAQQLEQRETLAIQTTIELRKMIEQVPVHDGVRQFLYQVWADVIATSAVRDGRQAPQTRVMQGAAGELIWAATPKATRDERSQVIRRVPALLKTLRAGMTLLGMAASAQDARLDAVNLALKAAFTTKGPGVAEADLEVLKARLETLEAVLPIDEISFQDDFMLDLTGDEVQGFEVVSEGGSLPGPAMLSWADELKIGEWFRLEYRGRTDNAQLVWRGMRRHLTLFVGPDGRSVLFQKPRLAAFLQAGLLLPAQQESLTVAATRTAIAKINADPSRLLN